MNTVPTNKCAKSQLSLTTCITIFTAKVNFVYVSLLNQQGNGDFEFISLCFFFFFFFSAVTVSYIRYQHTISYKSYDMKIGSFCFLLVAVSK